MLVDGVHGDQRDLIIADFFGRSTCVDSASADAAADSAGFWLEQPVMLAAARAAQLNSANTLFFIKILLKILICNPIKLSGLNILDKTLSGSRTDCVSARKDR